MNKAKRLAILTRLRENDPHPTTELHFSSPFELLIAVLLSAQATDVSVNKATAKLYPVANTPAAMLALGVDGVKSYIKTIGLFNSKAEKRHQNLPHPVGAAQWRGAGRQSGAGGAARRGP
ncbi:Endonuclease III [Klebsiella pneumoniae IS53]|nr:Endonuclease III [Klebsiella pneumoniae IS53]CDL64480.1 Endonuclease III [Klebsiella pneumoniae IS39]